MFSNFILGKDERCHDLRKLCKALFRECTLYKDQVLKKTLKFFQNDHQEKPFSIKGFSPSSVDFKYVLG